jgi:hypothetical protein
MSVFTRNLLQASWGFIVAAFCLPTLTLGQLIYMEQGGVVVGEGEHFTSRVAVFPEGDNWLIVPDEDAGAGTLSGARGRFVQSLPDQAGGGGGPLVAPEAQYQMAITTPGTYQLYLRWANNQNVGGGGNSDSIFADVVEIKDGVGMGQADWYELTRNSATFDWDGGGQAEVNQAGAADNPMTWNIASPGTYTLRITQREDGSALDAFAFQDSSLPAPAGFGPSASLLTTDMQFDSLTPEADSYVQLGEPSTNFGSSDHIVVKDSGTGTTTRKGYLRFDVSGQPLDELTNAELQLEVSINNNGGSPLDPTPNTYTVDIYGLNDADIGENWGESTIDWTNAPANDTANNDILSNATLLGQFGVPALNPTQESTPILVSFNNLMSAIPDALLDFLAADTDGQVTFILARDGGDNNLAFYSVEGATANGAFAPTLTLFAPADAVPEPATLALGVIGLLLLCLVGRRRRGR